MAARYGALTLQLKNLSDLSNIGSTHTNIFSATGKQVLSGVGSGSFSYSARDNTLHTAVKAADGQVAYIYQTDAVASGAAMDVCCIIIDSRNITTSADGATVSVSGQDILDQLTYTNAGTGAIDNGSGGPSTTDLDDIMTFAAAGWSYTATGTGSGTRSSTGSYHATKGDNVMQLLIATAKRSGDIFRLSSYSPPAKTVAWRASADSSGVTLRMPTSPTTYDGSTTDGIILSMTEDTDVSERITGVRPYGAGIGDGRLDITGIDSGDTGGDPSGYSTTFASNVIVNTTLETALGYTKRIDVDFSDIGVEDGTNATQLTSAAVDLWREAINFLQERDGAKTFYRVRCIVAYDLRPGQTVAVNYTEYEGGASGGSAVWTVNSSFTIHEVTNSVGQDGLRYTDLQIANTVKKQATPERVLAEAVRKTQATTRKSDIGTSPGSVSTGRTINATQPVRIDGGASADLSADRTLSINGLTTVGTANQIPGTNAGGTAWEYKTVTAGTGITVGHTANTITITNSSPGGADISGLAYVTIGNTASLSAERALTAGDGLDLTDGGANSTVTIAVDVTDFIDTSFGLTESTNNIRVNLAATSGLSFSTGALQLDDSVAGAGLTIASKVLAVGAGDGIDVAADSVAVDVTDLVGDGLVEQATNNLALGTPGSITSTSTNAVTTSSHTHAIDSTIALTATTITAGAGLTGGGSLAANRTINVAAADTSMTINADSIQVALAATSGLQVSSGLMIADTVAGSGLTIASKVLAVGAGDGIDVAADAIAVDVTDLVGDGLVEQATNNLALGTPSTLTVATSNGVTTTSHTHAITTSSDVTAASILASDADGRLGLEGLGIGTTAGADAITMADDTWIGLGASAGRLIFDNQTTDVIRVRAANLVFYSDATAEDKLFIRNSGDVENTESDIYADARLGLAAETDICFFIDSANDSTTDAFRWYINGESQVAGSEIARLTEAGVFTLKTPGLTTGVTTLYETDVHGAVQVGGGSGALFMTGIGTSTSGAIIRGIATTANTTKTTAAASPIIMRANLKSGTTAGAMSANGNLLVIQDDTSTRWIVDVEGDTYRDGTDNTFDTYHDAHLARAFDRAVSPGAVIDSEFDEWVKYGRHDLERAGILSPDSGFYNESRLLRLAIGAVWQEYTERQRLALRVQELERRLLN